MATVPPLRTTTTVVMSEQHAAEVGEHLPEVSVEARRRGTVDDAVIVRERQRQRQAWHEGLAVPYRLHRALRQAEDRDLGRVDDRCEMRAADAAQRADREAAAGHVGRPQLAVARLL